MACGCTGGAVSSPSSPILLGEANGEVTRVVSTVNFRKMKPGVTNWVTGDQVAVYIDSGTLRIK